MRISNTIVFIFIFIGSVCSIQAATFTVTNTNDSGSGSLRQAIIDLNASVDATNDIVVALSGSGATIFLQSQLPAITNNVTLNGADQNSSEILTIDGSQTVMSSGIEVSGSAASDSVIEYLGITNIIGSGSSEIAGIFLTNQAVNCSIQHCVITTVTQGFVTGVASGIKLDASALYTGCIAHNVIRDIEAQIITGILIDGDIGSMQEAANCNNNEIFVSTLAGIATVSGIVATTIYGNCTGNTIEEFLSAIRVTTITGDCNANRIQRNNDTTSSIVVINITTLQGNFANNILTNLLSTGPIIAVSIDELDGDCSYNCIKNIATESPDSGKITAFLIGTLFGDFLHNTIDNLVTGDGEISSGGIVAVSADIITGTIAYNCIENLQTGSAPVGVSGDIFGFIIGEFEGLFLCNEMRNFTTGDGILSGAAIGLLFFRTDRVITATIQNNSFTQFISGPAQISGNVRGIEARNGISGDVLSNSITQLYAGEGGQQGVVRGMEIAYQLDAPRGSAPLAIECNTVTDLRGGQRADNPSGTFDQSDGNSAGIWVHPAEEVFIGRNTLKRIEAKQTGGIAHGIRLGQVALETDDPAIDCLIEQNVIHQISAESSEAYGITIESNNSFNNSLLGNSISNIDTAAIYYKDGAATDATVTLSLIECSGRFVTISGILAPSSRLLGNDFLVQFFVSTLAFPVQTKIFIGEQIIPVDKLATPFMVTFEPTTKIFDSQFVTATATALPGSVQNLNTSVVSNALFGCTSSIAGLCNIVTTCPNDDNLPVPECPVPEVCNACVGSC